MFKKPVVFIIGAGASADYDMPLGGTLASTIAADVDFYFERHGPPKKGDATLYDFLRSKFPRDQVQKYVLAGRRLAGAISSAASIDDALYQLSDYPEVVQLGKLCIVRSIARAEGKSALKFSMETGRVADDAGKNGWIEQMFSMAIAGVKQGDLRHAFDNITFVNFNYDRCLEHYLFWSLQRVGVPEGTAAEIINGLSVIRPYGTLGSVMREPGSLSFGNTHQTAAFDALTRIRTFTESEALHDKEHLRRAMSEAKMFIFLGFGFHQQNLELLSTLETVPVRDDVQALATVYQVDRANLEQLRLFLQTVLKVNRDRIEVLDKKAGDMLRDLRLRIMLVVG
jgi:hypothetical protein